MEAKAFAIQGLEAFHAIAGGHWEKGLQLITKAGLGVGLSTDTLWTSQCELLSFGKKKLPARPDNSLSVPGQVLNKALCLVVLNICVGGDEYLFMLQFGVHHGSRVLFFFSIHQFVTLTHGVWQDDGIASRPQ